MDFTQETEDVLLGYMAMQHADPETARGAWHELYRRHHRYFIAVLSRAHGKDLGGPDGAIDITIEAFRELYEWAGRQRDPDAVVAKFTGLSPEATRMRVLGYMTEIAKHIFINQVRQDSRGPGRAELDDEAWESEWRRRSQNPVRRPSPAIIARYEQALALLSEREAEVLRLSLPWYDPDKGNDGEFDFPPGEAERVATSIGTTPENFRQIRSRAIRRVRAALDTVQLASAAKGDLR